MHLYWRTNKVTKSLGSFVIDLPVPINISSMWNLGSLLGLSLVSQILSGIFLAAYYHSDTSLAFMSVSYISMEVNGGWLFRVFHTNGASFFFFILYLHIARGLYYMSYHNKITWILGVFLLLLVMATAFLGYVLPWGQMSFWGASVITNLFSAIPYLGEDIVVWLWGGFSVSNATLTRFFSFHFLVPFVILALVILHLIFLHDTGSNNPLGIYNSSSKVAFHPYFSIKDYFGVFMFMLIMMTTVFFFPWNLGDPENFIEANSMVTPIHIQPEWYFLFAYAILRAIPNKLGGVIALGTSILILLILPYDTQPKFKSLYYYPLSQVYFWSLISTVFLLTWVGMRPVEEPYITLSMMFSIYYFLYFLLAGFLMKFWDRILM